jgi:biotin carboxyl carrier protein
VKRIMVRRYRIETYSGELFEIEVDDDKKKNYLKVRLVGEKGEIKVKIRSIKDDMVALDINGEPYYLKLHGDTLLINDENPLVSEIVELLPIGLSHYSKKASKAVTLAQKGEIRAPISGKINKINVKPGDRVSVGDVLILMESMKMITEVKSDMDGIVEEVLVEPGQAVNRNTLLLRIRPLKEPSEEKKKE